MNFKNASSIAPPSVQSLSRKFLRNDNLEKYMKSRIIPCKFIDDSNAKEKVYFDPENLQIDTQTSDCTSVVEDSHTETSFRGLD